MSEREPGAERREGGPETGAGLPSARERAPQQGGGGGGRGGAHHGPGRGKRDRDRGRDGSSRPRPAREVARPETAPSPPAEEPERVIEAGQERWTVRVLGRAGGSTGVRAAPLLLLGFSRDGAPSREALLVGRELASLTDEALERALAGARPEAGAERGGFGG